MPVQTQIINGQSYVQYSPQWYDAMHAEAQRQAAAKGTAAGTEVAAATKAAGGSTGGAGGSGATGISTGGGYTPAPPASITGLHQATSGGGSPDHAHMAPVDTSAAESASFNKAKDQVGLESSGALAGLRSALGGRGMLGSGLEERGTAAAATSAAGQLGDVSRQQAVTRADEAQKNAEANFQGDITQRGQDFQHEESDNSLAVTQRGQDISDRNAQRALELEQAQLGAQQRSTALAGLEAALRVSAPGKTMY